MHDLPGKFTPRIPVKRFENIAHRSFYRAFAFEHRLRQAGIHAPQCLGLECTLPYRRGGIETGYFACPAFAQLKALLRIGIEREYRYIYRSARTEIRFVGRIIGIHVGKYAVPFVLEGIADIQAGDVGQLVLLNQQLLPLLPPRLLLGKPEEFNYH